MVSAMAPTAATSMMMMDKDKLAWFPLLLDQQAQIEISAVRQSDQSQMVLFACGAALGNRKRFHRQSSGPRGATYWL